MDPTTSTSNFIQFVRQRYYKVDCFHAPMREGGKGSARTSKESGFTVPRAKHVFVCRTLFSCCRRKISHATIFVPSHAKIYLFQYCFEAVSAEHVTQLFLFITRQTTVISALLPRCKVRRTLQKSFHAITSKVSYMSVFTPSGVKYGKGQSYRVFF